MKIPFDHKVFLAALKDGVKPLLSKVGKDAKAIEVRYDELQQDVEATLKRLADESTTPEHRAQLLADMQEYLPARKEFILTIVQLKAGSDAAALFDAALDVTIKAAVGVAKALI